MRTDDARYPAFPYELLANSPTDLHVVGSFGRQSPQEGLLEVRVTLTMTLDEHADAVVAGRIAARPGANTPRGQPLRLVAGSA